MFLYLYDVHAKEKKSFNRVKRRFYYRLNMIVPDKELWRTKSAILVSAKYTRGLDSFFKDFKGLVTVYKASVRSLEELD